MIESTQPRGSYSQCSDFGVHKLITRDLRSIDGGLGVCVSDKIHGENEGRDIYTRTHRRAPSDQRRLNPNISSCNTPVPGCVGPKWLVIPSFRVEPGANRSTNLWPTVRLDDLLAGIGDLVF